jgi:hypothetical protein
MSFLILVLFVLLFLGGGGFYIGGVMMGSFGVGLVLLTLLILYLTGQLKFS